MRLWCRSYYGVPETVYTHFETHWCTRLIGTGHNQETKLIWQCTFQDMCQYLLERIAHQHAHPTKCHSVLNSHYEIPPFLYKSAQIWDFSSRVATITEDASSHIQYVENSVFANCAHTNCVIQHTVAACFEHFWVAEYSVLFLNIPQISKPSTADMSVTGFSARQSTTVCRRYVVLPWNLLSGLEHLCNLCPFKRKQCTVYFYRYPKKLLYRLKLIFFSAGTDLIFCSERQISRTHWCKM